MKMRKKIKILFVSHSSGMAGAERSLLLLLENINRRCFEPLVIFHGNGALKEETQRLNIKIYEIESPWWIRRKKNLFWTILQLGYCIIQEAIALFKLYKILKKEKVDVIYTNTMVIFSGAIIASILKKPHIWHIREIISDNTGSHFFLPCNILFKFILKFSSKVIVNSNATADQFKISKLDKKIKMIYNAVNTEEFKGVTSFSNINEVKPKDWLVAVVGNLQINKAQDDAIRAVKIAKKKITNIKLLLIGKGNEDFEKYLKRLTIKLNISDSVIFTGYRDDVPKILPHCKLLLMPSLNESFGRVTIEAMAAGIPVIGANIKATKEIIGENSITGYLVSPRNPLEIAEKMTYLFYHPNIAKKMGSAGRKLVEEKYSVESYTQSIEKVIQEVIM